MADIDIDPFGEHDRNESTTDDMGKYSPHPSRGINLETRTRTRNFIQRRRP